MSQVASASSSPMTAALPPDRPPSGALEQDFTKRMAAAITDRATADPALAKVPVEKAVQGAAQEVVDELQGKLNSANPLAVLARSLSDDTLRRDVKAASLIAAAKLAAKQVAEQNPAIAKQNPAMAEQVGRQTMVADMAAADSPTEPTDGVQRNEEHAEGRADRGEEQTFRRGAQQTVSNGRPDTTNGPRDAKARAGSAEGFDRTAKDVRQLKVLWARAAGNRTEKAKDAFYKAAVDLFEDSADELRRAAQGEGDPSKRIKNEANVIKGKVSGRGPEDAEARKIIDQVEQQVLAETPEFRSTQILARRAVHAQEAVKELGEENSSNGVEWHKAKTASDNAANALLIRSLGELGTEIASAHLAEVQASNIATPAERKAAVDQLKAAREGKAPPYFTDTELIAGVNAMKRRYQGAGLDAYFDGLAKAVTTNRDQAEAARKTIAAGLEGQKAVLQENDPVRAAFMQALKLASSEPASMLSDQEQAIQKADPLAFALLQKADIRIRTNDVNTTIVTAGGKPLRLTDEQQKMVGENNIFGLARSLLSEAQFDTETRALIAATVEARRNYARDTVAAHLAAGKDNEALAILDVNMRGAFSPEEADFLWNQYGEQVFNRAYFDRKVDEFIAKNGNDPTMFANRAGQWIKNNFGKMPPVAAGHLVDSIIAKFNVSQITVPIGQAQFYSDFSGLLEQAPDRAAAAANWYTSIPGREDGFRNPPDSYGSLFRWAVERGNSAALSAAIVERAEKLASTGKLYPQTSKNVRSEFNSVLQTVVQKGQVERLSREIFDEFERKKDRVLTTYFDALKTGHDVTEWISSENTPALRNRVGRTLGLAPTNQKAANALNDSEDWYDRGPQRNMVDLTVKGLMQEAGPGGQIRAIPAYLAGKRVGARSYALFETRTATGEKKVIDGTVLAGSIYTNKDLVGVDGRLINFPGKIDSYIFAGWKYDSFRKFQDDNETLPNDAVLYLPQKYIDFVKASETSGTPVADPSSLLANANGGGHVAYTLKPEQAAITTGWEYKKMGAGLVLGTLAIVGGVVLVCVPGLGLIAAAGAYAALGGGIGWGIFSTVEQYNQMTAQGQSTAWSNPNARGLYLSAGVQAAGFLAFGAGSVISAASRPISSLANLSRVDGALNWTTTALNETRTGQVVVTVAQRANQAMSPISGLGGLEMMREQAFGILADLNDPNGGSTLDGKVSLYGNFLLSVLGPVSGAYAHQAGRRYSLAYTQAREAVDALQRGQSVPKEVGSFVFERDGTIREPDGTIRERYGTIRFNSQAAGRTAILRTKDGRVGSLPGIAETAQDFITGLTPEAIADRADLIAGIPEWRFRDQKLAGVSDLQWRSVRPDQIPTIPEALMRDIPVETWSRDQFRALSKGQTDAISPVRFGEIDPRNISDEQFGWLHPDQIRAIPSDKLPLIRTSLKGRVLRSLSDRQFVSIIPQIFSSLSLEDATPRQIGIMTDRQMGALRVRQIEKMHAAQFAAISPQQLARLTRRQRMAISEANMSGLDKEQRGALTSPMFATDYGTFFRGAEGLVYGDIVRGRYVRGLARKEILAHPDDPEWLSRIHPDELPNLLSPADFGSLTARGLSGFNLSHVAKLGPEYFEALSSSQRTAMYPLQRTYVVRDREAILKANKEQIRRTHPASIRNELRPEDIPLLKGRVAGFNLDHAAWLTPEQAAKLTQGQQEVIHPLVIGTFTKQTRAALRNVGGRVARILDWPIVHTDYGELSLAEMVPGPHNWAPRMMNGLPEIHPTSPVASVAMMNRERGVGMLVQRGAIASAALALAHARTRKVMLLTGFNVGREGNVPTGRILPETDGPPGTALAAKDLIAAGKEPVIVTDSVNAAVMRAIMSSLEVPPDRYRIIEFQRPQNDNGTWDYRQEARAILDREQPDVLWAIELPGRTNLEDPDPGTRTNMRGADISEFNQPLDELMIAARELGADGRGRRVRFIMATGDGGNEAGMGNVRDHVPPAMNGNVMASAVPADLLTTASVSNWGAQAVTALMLKFMGRRDRVHTERNQRDAIEASARAGAVDGIKRENKPWVDGMSLKAHAGWHSLLMEALDHPQTEAPIRMIAMDSSSGVIEALKELAWGLQQQTGRAVHIIIAADHGLSPYGRMSPDEIRVATNNVLRTMDAAFDGDAAPAIIVMACNTACTATGFAEGVKIPVINLVENTAAQMRELGGSHIVSLSTTATAVSHAYRNLVEGRPVAGGTSQASEGAAWAASGNRITEIGASAILKDANGVPIDSAGRPIPWGADGLPSDPGRTVADPELDLAYIVNNLPPESSVLVPPAKRLAYKELVRKAVEHYVRQIPEDATSIWLTCTHFPALATEIEAAVNARTNWTAGPPKVINPMEFQTKAAVALLMEQGLVPGTPETGQKMPSPPPILVTSAGRWGDHYNPAEIHELTKRTLKRDDVALVVSDFGEDRPQTVEQVFRASLRAKGPDDGTLYGFSTNMGVEIFRDGVAHSIWRPIEPDAMRAEYETYRAMKAQGFDATGAFADILEGVWDYQASQQGGGPGGRGRRRASDDTSPPGGMFGTAIGTAIGALRRDLPVIARDVAPIGAASLGLALFVPVPLLLTLNGVSWFARGAATVLPAVAPNWPASHPAGAKALRGLNWATFLGNSWHTHTLWSGHGWPQNPLYAVSNFVFGGQNANGNRGKEPYPKWIKNIGFAAGNIANGFLLFNYSIPAGIEAWAPTLLFGGGTTVLTARHYNADYWGGNPVKPTDLSTRLALGGSASGLMWFAGHYLVRVAGPALDQAGSRDNERKRSKMHPASEVSPGSAVTVLNLAPQAPPLLPPPAYSPAKPKVVNARRGLNVHSGPSSTSGPLGAFSDGTILQPMGQPQRDRTGRKWLQVKGMAIDGKERTGWVVENFVRSVP